MSNENEFTAADGVRYVAQESESLSCRFCAFERGAAVCPDEAPHCSERRRADGRPIIWVKAEDGSNA